MTRIDTARPAYHLGQCLAWTLGALVCFTTMAISLRAASGHFSAFEMLTLRNLAGVAALGALALARRELRAEIPMRRPLLHLYRNSCHFIGQYTWVQSVLLLPLATAFALEFTSPIWIALLAAAVLGEPLTKSRLVAIAAGFVGILIVLRPGQSVFQQASLFAVVAAVAFAFTTLGTKMLTRTESTFAILFWMNVIQLPLNFLGSDPWFLGRLSGAPLWPVAGVCLSGLLAHVCLTNAYRRGDALTVVPLDYLRLPLVAFIGAAFYAEPLDPFVFIGGGVIIAGVLYNVWAEAGRISH